MSLFNIYIILYITWLSAYDTCLLMLFLHVVFSGKLWGTSTVTSTFRTLAGSGRSMEATGTETVRCCRWEAVILIGRWKNWEKTWKKLGKATEMMEMIWNDALVHLVALHIKIFHGSLLFRVAFHCLGAGCLRQLQLNRESWFCGYTALRLSTGSPNHVGHLNPSLMGSG